MSCCWLLFILIADEEPTPLLLQVLLPLLPAPPDVTEGVSGPGLSLSGLELLFCPTADTAAADEAVANDFFTVDGEVVGT